MAIRSLGGQGTFDDDPLIRMSAVAGRSRVEAKVDQDADGRIFFRKRYLGRPPAAAVAQRTQSSHDKADLQGKVYPDDTVIDTQHVGD